MSDPTGKSNSGWGKAAGVIGASVGVGATLYYLFGQNQSKSEENYASSSGNSPRQAAVCRVEALPTRMGGMSLGTQKKNLDTVLHEIYNRYIALKDDDFELYYGVFDKVFLKLQERMKMVDPYYNKYSCRKQFAGSHYDSLRIGKPDEFDMDIVIALPLCFDISHSDPKDSDIIIENKSPGYVQLRMGQQFKRMPMRDDWETNKTTFNWSDNRDYLLRSSFINWFKSVVVRAIDTLDMNQFYLRTIRIGSVDYVIRLSESGPAITLIVENKATKFKLDVDFVPSIRFSAKRWPICRGYRNIPRQCTKDEWFVVPKPDKSNPSFADNSRCWRLAFHDQEKEIMKNLYHLKYIIRLMKKLRDSLGMKKIASYYIKTLFLWEVTERANQKLFWNQKISLLFPVMVEKLYQALSCGKIAYFWHPENNLLGGVHHATLAQYQAKLREVVTALNTQDCTKTARLLLTTNEYNEFSQLGFL